VPSSSSIVLSLCPRRLTSQISPTFKSFLTSSKPNPRSKDGPGSLPCKILPKEGEPVTKVADGTSYHLAYEQHPKQWVCHTSKECSKNPKDKDAPSTTMTLPRVPGNISRQLALPPLLCFKTGDDKSDGGPDTY
jgi:hypothetical protein